MLTHSKHAASREAWLSHVSPCLVLGLLDHAFGRSTAGTGHGPTYYRREGIRGLMTRNEAESDLLSMKMNGYQS